MPDPHANATMRRLGMSLVVTFVSVLLVVLLFACAGGAALLAPRDVAPFVGGGVILLFIATFVPGAMGFAIWRSRALDPDFRELGARGSGWVPNLREYHGSLDGRQLDALYARRSAMLQTWLSADVRSTLAVGTKTALGRALASLISEPEVPGPLPGFDNLVVRASDPEWGRAVLESAAVRSLILELVQDPTGRELRTVAIRPGALLLSRHYFVGKPEGVVPSVERLGKLAALVERGPRPTRPMEPSTWELRSRQAPTRIAGILVAAVLGSVVLMMLLSITLVLVFGVTGHHR